MMKDILNTTSVQRLKGILQSRYGTGLQVEFLTDAASVDMTSQSPSLHEGELRIPLFSGHHFLAKAILSNAHKISFEDYETVTDLIKLVLEPLITRWIETPESFSLEHGFSPAPNVVSLFNDQNLTVTEDHQSGLRSFLTSVIYLETKNPALLPKVVAEIHDISRRWACVHFDQIQNDIQSVRELQDLGAMTLVVNDVLNITPEKRQLLSDYLQSSPVEEMPLLVISSASGLRGLTDEQLVESQFLKQIQKCVLEIDRLPQKLSLLRETLELFLEPAAIL